MAVTALRPMPKFQAFDLNGDPLAGGKLYTYSAGTTTALETYTDSTGTVANANPVNLDSRGEASVWFQPLNYKLVLKDSSDNTIWTQDNYSGSPYPITDEWITYVHTWTYISATQVSVPGDQSAIYTANKAIRAVTTGGTYYGTITNSVYDGSTKTTLTVSFDTGSFDSGVAGSSTISIGVQSTQSPALTFAQTAINAPGTSATSTTSLTIGTGSKTLTIQASKSIVVGMTVKIAYTNSPGNWMLGDVLSYNTVTGELIVDVTAIRGSGTQAVWTISLTGPGGVTLDGAETLTNKTLTAPAINDATINGPMYTRDDDGTVSGGTWAIDYANGPVIKATAGANITSITMANWPASGTAGHLRLMLVNFGAYTITFPAAWKWVKSDLTTTTTFADLSLTLPSSGTAIVDLFSDDGGTNIYAYVARN